MTPFRSPTFRRLWYSSTSSAAAQGMERTATAWVALEAGGSAFEIGLIFAARMLPSLLFGLAAGTIADRADRPRQLLAVAGAAVLLMVAMSWLIGTGEIQIWQIVAFSFAAGCIQVFDIPARQALVLDTIPRDAALRALALIALAARFSGALGALAAGLLIPPAGLARCYLLIAAAYGVTAALMAAQWHGAPRCGGPRGRARRRVASSLGTVGPMVKNGRRCGGRGGRERSRQRHGHLNGGEIFW